jgi:hypothetical protein
MNDFTGILVATVINGAIHQSRVWMVVGSGSDAVFMLFSGHNVPMVSCLVLE